MMDAAKLLLLLTLGADTGSVGKALHTRAVYDISAATVTLPSGQRLVAHSGMGECRDNPACAGLRNRGPTPPGEYRLVERRGLFYGDRALALEPKDIAQMRGRDGILAHSYLGMGGNSFGCVSFETYREFLASFLRGEIDEISVRPGEGPVVIPASSAGARASIRRSARPLLRHASRALRSSWRLQARYHRN